jgi:hypothetical protein
VSSSMDDPSPLARSASSCRWRCYEYIRVHSTAKSDFCQVLSQVAVTAREGRALHGTEGHSPCCGSLHSRMTRDAKGRTTSCTNIHKSWWIWPSKSRNSTAHRPAHVAILRITVPYVGAKSCTFFSAHCARLSQSPSLAAASSRICVLEHWQPVLGIYCDAPSPGSGDPVATDGSFSPMNPVCPVLHTASNGANNEGSPMRQPSEDRGGRFRVGRLYAIVRAPARGAGTFPGSPSGQETAQCTL